jgi:hypothetical protein
MYKRITDFDIILTEEDVLKGQGVEPGRASERLVENARAVIDLALGLIQPAALVKIVDVDDFAHQRISFDGGVFEGGLVARALAGAEQLVVLVCTIGPALDNKVSDMMKENPVEAVTLDGAGIAAIRNVSRAMEHLVQEEAEELGLSLGMRASPGQEDWPIEQQRQLFTLLPTSEIGVQLTDSCLMLPRKSVSFIIPRGKKMSSDKIPCHFCSKRFRCNWRKDV